MSEHMNQGLIQKLNPEWLEGLTSLSSVEQGRIPEPQTNLKNVTSFQEVENLVKNSIAPPAPQTIPTENRSPKILNVSLPASKAASKPNLKSAFGDQELLKKLLSHRNHYQSGRILRGKPS